MPSRDRCRSLTLVTWPHTNLVILWTIGICQSFTKDFVRTRIHEIWRSENARGTISWRVNQGEHQRLRFCASTSCSKRQKPSCLVSIPQKIKISLCLLYQLSFLRCLFRFDYKKLPDFCDNNILYGDQTFRFWKLCPISFLFLLENQACPWTGGNRRSPNGSFCHFRFFIWLW